MLPLLFASTRIDLASIIGDDMPKQRYQRTIVHKSEGSHPYWYIRPRVDVITPEGTRDRKPKRIQLGLVTREFGKREAITKANQIMGTINQSRYMIQSQIRFGDFLEIYRHQHVLRRDGERYFLSASTQEKYTNHLNNHIEPSFKHLMLCEIDTKLIDAWITEKSKPRRITLGNGGNKREKSIPGLSWATRTDLRNIMCGIFTKAKDWGYWQGENPVERVSVGRKHAVREKRKLTDEQIRLFLSTVPEDVRIIVLVILSTTLRISEILGLQERDFDFDTGTIHVRRRYYRGDTDAPKSDAAERAERMGYLAPLLKKRMTGNPEAFVFSVMTKYGDSRDSSDINQHFLRPTAKKLGIYYQGFGFHAFRREGKTRLAEFLDPFQVMKMSGHSRADMSLLYTLNDTAKQEAAVRAVQERIMSNGAGAVN